MKELHKLESVCEENFLVNVALFFIIISFFTEFFLSVVSDGCGWLFATEKKIHRKNPHFLLYVWVSGVCAMITRKKKIFFHTFIWIIFYFHSRKNWIENGKCFSCNSSLCWGVRYIFYVHFSWRFSSFHCKIISLASYM